MTDINLAAVHRYRPKEVLHENVSYPGILARSNSDELWTSPKSSPELHSNKSLCVKCGKISGVTLGTPDVKSRPTRCQKGLQLQLMCCTPFRLLSQDFGTRRTEDWREDWSCSQSKT